jgi:predicted RNA binding protein YcfA (HicA-like mRNA interferase family)
VPLKPLSYREVKRKLETVSFAEVSQKGSHVKFVRDTGEGVYTAIVPYHREVAVGTLRSILRQARLSSEEFEAL